MSTSSASSSSASSQRGEPTYAKHGGAEEIAPVDRERFESLADEWERDTVLLSSSTQAARHPAHQEIVNMGEAAVPLILRRMESQGGHWFHALHTITGARPVPPESRGRIREMTEAWLDWGERNGYV